MPLVVSASPRGGRGVFAGAAIAEGQEVEVCRWDIDLNSGRISDVHSMYMYTCIYNIYICVCAPYSSKQLLRLDLELIVWIQRPSRIMVFGARGIYT